MKSKSKFDSSKPISTTNSLFLSPGFQRTQDDSSMDWSADPAPASPPPCVPPVGGEHMSLPHVPLPNRDSIRKSRAKSSNSGPSVLNYGNNQLLITSFWNGVYYILSIFETEET